MGTCPHVSRMIAFSASTGAFGLLPEAAIFGQGFLAIRGTGGLGSTYRASGLRQIVGPDQNVGAC